MSDGLQFMLFTAPGCVPCGPAKAALARLLDAGLVVGIVVDVTEKPALAANYDVQAVPTLVVRRGQAIDSRHVGTKATEYLVKLEKELTRGR